MFLFSVEPNVIINTVTNSRCVLIEKWRKTLFFLFFLFLLFFFFSKLSSISNDGWGLHACTICLFLRPFTTISSFQTIVNFKSQILRTNLLWQIWMKFHLFKMEFLRHEDEEEKHRKLLKCLGNPFSLSVSHFLSFFVIQLTPSPHILKPKLSFPLFK